ncbi:hypothetical protein ACFL2D_02620, partial [Patescibacteria group bacterium]
TEDLLADESGIDDADPRAQAQREMSEGVGLDDDTATAQAGGLPPGAQTPEMTGGPTRITEVTPDAAPSTETITASDPLPPEYQGVARPGVADAGATGAKGAATTGAEAAQLDEAYARTLFNRDVSATVNRISSGQQSLSDLRAAAGRGDISAELLSSIEKTIRNQ